MFFLFLRDRMALLPYEDEELESELRSIYLSVEFVPVFIQLPNIQNRNGIERLPFEWTIF